MSDVFEEVEETMRRERLVKALRRFGPWLVALFVLALASVFGWQQYQAWEERERQTFSDRYIAAQDVLRGQDFAAAEAALSELTADAPGGYQAALAHDRAALLQRQQGKLQEAADAYLQAAELSPAPTFADLARLRAAYLLVDLDKAKAETEIERLIAGGGPWALLARELRAVEAYAAGDFAKAREDYEFIQLGGLDSPPGLRRRAELALSILGPTPAQAEEPPAAAPTAEETP